MLRKYGRNKVIKQVRNIKLVIPCQGIKLNSWSKTITIPCLNKYSFQYHLPPKFEKVNQIEIGDKYLYVSVSIREKETLFAHKYLGVDLNTTGHVAVVSNPNTGKVWKLGKIAEHIHRKYKNIRKGLQKQGKYKKVKQIRNKESRIVRNLNHHISKKIVDIATKAQCGVRLEKLQNIR